METKEITEKLLAKLKENEEVFKIEMTPDNWKEISYVDKYIALGSINAYMYAIKLLDPTFEYNLEKALGLEMTEEEKALAELNRSWR